MQSALQAYVRDVGRGLIDIIFPATCLYCRCAADGPLHQVLCRDCYSELQPAALRFAELHILNRLPNTCLDQLLVTFHFNEVVRSLIHAIKYQHMPRLATAIGEVAILKAAWTLDTPALLIPVPLHAQRRRERGYNQSTLIARGIKNSNLTLCTDLLQRTRYTNTQTHLKRQARQQNLANAFALRPKAAAKIAGQHIILVDDVMTTGATLSECAMVLKKAGARQVTGIALAAPIREGEAIADDSGDFLLF